MKILALADIHGSYKSMMDIVSANLDVDVIVVAGDLTTYGSVKEAEEAIGQLQSFKKPLLVIGGNMDPVELDDTFVKLGVSINACGVIIDSVGFFGVSAAPLSPLKTPNEITENEISRRADAGWKGIVGAKCRVFVPHSPPIHTKLDRITSGIHVGSKAVRTFIEQNQPDITICGHIHEAFGLDKIGKTQIINCGPVGKGYYGLVSINDKIEVENRNRP